MSNGPEYINAQIRLEESQERFKQLFEHIPSGVAVYKAIEDGNNFIFIDFNPAAEKIEGVKKEDIIGKCVTEVFPGVKEFGIFESFQRVYRTGKAEFLPAKMYKDDLGHTGWRENWIYKLPSQEIVAVYNDVSEHINAEEKIMQNLRYLEVFYKSSIGREERILELKAKIKELEEKLRDINEKK